ncbi:MAG: hypothetical protein EXQ49_07325 [Acidobacteria bacterium]|nr:hypothetical protein [Acidobacteriota bacterium]
MKQVLGVQAMVLAALLVATEVSGQVAPEGQPPVELTLDRMVALRLRDSLSRISLNIAAPQFQAISDNKWNSVLQRNELVREDTRRFQMDLSVRQPVILFGYPTNGVLSLNNRVYRYTQVNDDGRDTTFYNQYFVAYDQPLFQPNRMKNEMSS